MERGRVEDAFGESRKHAATIRARIHLNGIRALAHNGLEQLRLAELQLLTLETEPCNSEALGAVARAFCNLRKAARRRKLRDLYYYVADQEHVLREAFDASFVSESVLDTLLDAIEVLKQYLAHTEEAVTMGEALPLPKTLPALRRTIQSPVSPPHAAAPVSPDHARKRLGELLMASGDISEGDLQVALFEYEGHNGHRRLGELLLEDLRISREQLDRAIAVQRENPDRPLLGQVLLSMGLLSTTGLNRTLEKQKHPAGRRLGEMLVRRGWVPAKRVVTALRRQSVVRDAVRYGLASLAPRLTTRAVETGYPHQRTRFPADQATELTLFCDKARDLLAVADRNLLVLETESQNDVALDSVRRAIHAMARFACYLGLADLGRFGRAFCGYLAAVAQGRFSLEGPRLDVAFDCIEVLRRHLGYVEEALNNKSRMHRERKLREYIAVLGALSAGNCESLRIGAVSSCPQGKKVGDILVSRGFITRETLDAGLAAQAEAPETPRLGEILVGQARVSRDQTEAALAAQQENPSLGKLGHILVQWGLVDPKAIETALAEQRGRRRPRLGEVFMQIGAVSAKAIAQALRRQRLGQAGAAAALVAASFMAPAIPAGSSIVEQPGDTDVVWIMEEGQSLHTEREELREAVKAALAASPTLPETDSDGMLDSSQSGAVPLPPGGAEAGEDEAATEESAPDFDETEYWNAPQVARDAGALAAVSGTPSRFKADTNAESRVSATDIQCMINAALDLDTPVPANLNRAVALRALDIQSIIKKALGAQAG